MKGFEPRSLLSRALEAAFALLAVAVMLSWAWRLLEPLVPVLVAAGVVVALLVVVLRWWKRTHFW